MKGVCLMDESTQPKQKSGLSKKTLIIVIGLILIIGGSVAAFVLLDKTTKEQYFLAEKETMDTFSNSLEEKYKLESEWAEKTMENPNRAEHRVQLDTSGADMGGGEFGALDPFAMLSNVAFLFTLERDQESKQGSVDLGVELGNFDVGKLGIALSEHDLFLELPFTDDIITFSDSDLNKKLHEEDPYSFPEEGFIDFTDMFDYMSGEFLSEEDQDYIQDEYVTYIYDLLPESAFTEDKDSITVMDDKVKANKITFHLTEEEIQDILEDVLAKLADDKKIKEIMKDYLEKQMFVDMSMDATGAGQTDMLVDAFIEDFDDALEIAKEEISSFHAPDGFTSTIWIDKNSIVQRDMSFAFGPEEDDLLSVQIEGAHVFTKDKQEFDMDITFGDTYEEFTTNIAGEFNWKDDKGDDYVVLNVDGDEITYEATEEKTGKSDKEFSRSIQLTDDRGEDIEITWSGDASYTSEKMKSSHTFSLIENNVAEEVSIILDKKGTILKEIDFPDASEAVDLGELEMFELEMYVDKLAGEFEQWLQGLMGGGDFFNF